MIARSLRGVAAALVLVAAIASVGQAQKASSGRFAIAGGLAMPMGDFDDLADMGFQVGGSYTVAMNDMYSLRFNADWSHYAVPGGGANWTQLGLMANAVAGMKDRPVYGLIGLGLVNTKLTIDAGGDASSSDFAFNIGGGFNKNNWAIEARYQSAQANGGSINSIPIVFVWKF